MSDRSDGTRLRLKRQSGWFAAGQEVDWALQLLSDAAFKLFVWLCLHAERSRGAVLASPAELGRTLDNNEHDICLALEELERQGVCNVNAEGVIEIRDRFWPYQRQCQSSASNESHHYVAEVKRLLLQRRCVQSSFTAADEKLAVSLFRRGIPLLQVEHAILLGAARKYSAISQHGQGTPISSLHYFADLFEEVRQQTSPGYWTYIAHKVKTFEQTWGAGWRAPDEQQRARQTQRGDRGVDHASRGRSEAILMQRFFLKNLNSAGKPQKRDETMMNSALSLIIFPVTSLREATRGIRMLDVGHWSLECLF